MQGDIFIIGQIGSGPDESGNIIRGVELVDVIAQFRAIAADQKEVEVVIESPGGYVDTGDAIYNYLESKKADGYKIKTIQRGIIGSIATKIFMAGDVRVVNDSQQFFIHNPLVQNVTGDANVMQAVANQLQESKNKLLSFYLEKTGNNAQAIEPLMDSETSLTADEAVALGFATEKVTSEKVFATINKTNMDIKKSFEDIMTALKALRPKAAMDVQLADGKSISVDSADGQLKGASTNAPDGEHALADGKIITVAGGKITDVKEAQAMSEEEKKKMEEEQKAAAAYVTVAQFNEFSKELLESVKAIKEDSAKELVDIKNQIKGTHTPPKKKQNADSAANNKKTMSAKEILALRAEGKIEDYKIAYKEKYGKEPEL